ncbi:hypothetical protein KA017_03710 [Candidatus Woesebacteria bacterium]|nr:hypothetical protein [Candidatus Woesebacteria bacterium]
MLKKIFAVLSIGVITIAGLSMFSPVTKVEAAECTLSLVLNQLVGGNGPPSTFSTDSTVTFNASDILSLHYETKSCALYQQTRAYQITYSSTYSGEATGAVVKKGNLSKDLNGDIEISKPTKNRTDEYEFRLYKSNGEYFPVQKFTIKYVVKGSTDTTTGSQYSPEKVRVCKVSDTSSRIYWSTKGETNSVLEYWPSGGQPKIAKGTDLKLKEHSLLLQGLTVKDSEGKKKYGFYIHEPPAGQTISTTDFIRPQSGFLTFEAGITNDSGCVEGKYDPTKDTTTPPGTTEPPNNSTPNDQINTGITAKLGDLDEVLGSIFNPLTVWSVPELITSIIRVLFALISIAAIVLIIISGFRMVLASGNEEQLTKAKKAITWAIIGLIVSLLSFSIVSIIQNLISR